MDQDQIEANQRSLFATGWILSLANLLPLIAVWKLDWNTYDLLVLYWVEVILIGVINVLRMIFVTPLHATASTHLLKLFFVPFFIGHFGFFCVGVGLAIQVVFGKENFLVEDQMRSMMLGEGGQVFWPFVISHFYSFAKNFLQRREFRKTTVMRRMISPYIRIIPQTLCVIGAAWFFGVYQSVAWAAYAVIGIKTVADLIIHLWLHRRVMFRPDKDLQASAVA